MLGNQKKQKVVLPTLPLLIAHLGGVLEVLRRFAIIPTTDASSVYGNKWEVFVNADQIHTFLLSRLTKEPANSLSISSDSVQKSEYRATEKKEEHPTAMNAFELISMSFLKSECQGQLLSAIGRGSYFTWLHLFKFVMRRWKHRLDFIMPL